MTEDKDKKLVAAFPLLYADRNASMRSTCMCWGFSCGDGWFDLIWRLSEKLERLIAAIPDEMCYCGHARVQHSPECLVLEPIPADNGLDVMLEAARIPVEERCMCRGFTSGRPKASQVKEKYGTLRFYMTHETDEIGKAIREAEFESAVTCEHCGAPGKTHGNGWIRTLCDACEDERKKPKTSP
jgi:hypothetical protein